MRAAPGYVRPRGTHSSPGTDRYSAFIKGWIQCFPMTKLVLAGMNKAAKISIEFQRD